MADVHPGSSAKKNTESKLKCRDQIQMRNRLLTLSYLCRPKAGSLTELRGKKANIEVYREMLELCQVIDTEGYMKSKEEPESRMIPFGELFNVI
jgi:hypothetical protein